MIVTGILFIPLVNFYIMYFESLLYDELILLFSLNNSVSLITRSLKIIIAHQTCRLSLHLKVDTIYSCGD